MNTSIRKQLLGLTTAALAVGTLGLTGSPAQAVGGIDGGNVSGSGDVPTSVDVVAFGSGDALAAWTKPVVGGTKVYAAIASDGVWAAAKPVTAAPVTDAHDVRAVANDKGDLAVVWNQTTGGEHKVRGSRYLANGSWDGSTLLSPAVDIETVLSIDAGMDGAGRVHVAYEAENDTVHRVQTTMWAPGVAPQLTAFDDDSFEPSIDVNESGDVLMSYFDSTNGTEVKSTRRNANVGWLGPKSLSWIENVTDDTVAVLADNGEGAVMMGGMEDGKVRAVVTRVSPNGTLGFPQVLSAAGVNATWRDLAMSPNGTMQATWSAFENGGYVVRAALAKPAQGFGTAGIAEPSTALSQQHRSLVSDGADQVVVHDDADQLTLRHHTNPVLPWGQYDAGAANGAFAADMDREGNAVAVGVVENGFSSYVQADFLDIAGPTAKITAPGTQAASPSFDVAWNVTDSLSGVKSTDVMARTAAWNGGFGPQQVIANNVTTTTSQPFAGAFGSTYCFQAQGADKANNLGFRSEERCTTVPLDDTALNGKKWKRIAKAGAFNNTATVTKKHGRKLTLTGIQARHLDLILTKAKKGGKVKVYWNGTLIKKISLKGKGQATIALADFGTVQTGNLTVKVVSKTGRKVTIDGLVAAK